MRRVLSSAAAVAASALRPRINFARPVFVLSAWRSGSSLLADVIHAHTDTWSAPRECDDAWWTLFPYADTDWTDELTRDDLARVGGPAPVQSELLAHAIKRRGPAAVGYWLRAVRRRSRYLEKTIANAFHLDLIAAAFPDATYVHLVRDPRENISSMMELWRSGRFSRRPLPEGSPFELDYWCGPYPPGWQAELHRPMNEMCAWCWNQHNGRILDDLDTLNLRERTVTVWYGDLLADADAVLERVAKHAELPRTGAGSAQELIGRASWSTISAPRKDKWKEKNLAAIRAIEPMVEPIQRRIEEIATAELAAERDTEARPTTQPID